MGCGKKFRGEKTDFTKSDKDNSVRRKRRVVHYGIQKRKIGGITKRENRRKEKIYLQGLPTLGPENVIAAGIKHSLGKNFHAS